MVLKLQSLVNMQASAGLGFRVLGFRVQCFGVTAVRVWSSGFRVLGAFRLQASVCRLSASAPEP